MLLVGPRAANCECGQLVPYCIQASIRMAMTTTTFTVRVSSTAKKRLEKLAKSTGRSRSFLAAEAINGYLDVNEWQGTNVQNAMASLDRGKGIPHQRVKEWVNSSGSKRERSAPNAR